MNGCQTCGGYGMHHDPVAHDAELEAQAAEWKAHAIASLREGRCPHSGLLMLRNGIARPACSVCDCFGFDDEVTA